MSDPPTDDSGFDPASPDHREVGRVVAEGEGDAPTVFAHLYRGEVDRMTTWRRRLDQTTYWAVTLMAATLTWTF